MNDNTGCAILFVLIFIGGMLWGIIALANYLDDNVVIEPLPTQVDNGRTIIELKVDANDDTYQIKGKDLKIIQKGTGISIIEDGNSLMDCNNCVVHSKVYAETN